MSKNKDKKAAALQSENEALTRNLELANQEHKEQVTVLVIPPWLLLTTMQQEATMQMVKNLHATNKSMEEDIENHKKVELEKVLLPIPPPPKHYYWIKEMLSLFIMRLSASLTFSSLSIVIPG